MGHVLTKNLPGGLTGNRRPAARMFAMVESHHESQVHHSSLFRDNEFDSRHTLAREYVQSEVLYLTEDVERLEKFQERTEMIKETEK